MSHSQESNGQQQSLLQHYQKSEFRQRRGMTRKSCRIPVTFSSENEDHYADLMENISPDGAFIRTDTYFFPGEALTLSIPYSNGKKRVSVRGKVVRHDEQGIGIKFEKRNGTPVKTE